MTRFFVALAAWSCLTSAAQAATWDEPSDRFVDRGGIHHWEQLSQGQVGVVLPSRGRLALYLSYRALTLDPKALAAANESAKLARQRREEADRRGGAIQAWATERGLDLKAAPGWSAWGVDRAFGPGIFGGYVNCAPDAFRLAVDTLADLRRRKDVKAQEVAEWVAAQDAVFAFCSDGPGASKAGAETRPTTPAALPARAAPLLRQLRAYQIAAALFYGGNHAAALAAFDAIAKTPGHAMRGWAAVAGLRTVLRTATLDLEWERTYAETRVAGLDPADVERRLAAAREHMRQVEAHAVGELRTRTSAILASKELAPVHEVTRSTLDSGLRSLAPAAWWTQAAERLAQLEQHPLDDDGTLLRWAETVGNRVDLTQLAELDTLRARHDFLDWIATIQACTDSPASPHARGRCDDAHAHALVTWAGKGGPAWLVAALATTRTPVSAEESLLRAAAQVPTDRPEWESVRYHAVRLLAAAGRREEAVRQADEALKLVKQGSDARQLLLQQRFALSRTLAELGPFLARSLGKNGAAIGADGDRLLNRTLASEDLLALAELPQTPRALAAELYVSAWFRADLVGKPQIAEAAARRAKAEFPQLASAVDFYLTTKPAMRHASLVIAAMSSPISPVVGWRRTPRRSVWWCAVEPAAFAAQEAKERTPPPPSLTGLVDAREEQAKLRALGPGGTYEVGQLIAVAKALPLSRKDARPLFESGLKALESDGCPNPDAPRLRAELEEALGALR
jgi:hypothetical protein